MEDRRFEKEWKKAVTKRDGAKIRAVAEAIYNAYYRLLFKVSYAILLNQQDAEDITEESFVSFFSRMDETNDVSNIKYYLLNTAKYLSYRHKSHEETFVEFDEEKADALFEMPVELLLISPTIKNTKGLLCELEATVLIQHLEYGFSFREIGESMNKTVNSISSIYRSAIGKLKKIYQEK
ncbi:MAG: sigma-70 family RNA polymerase sigma factor [Bacilli bacterium]|nr:sigma-70 family RNA polymerase sigma factor [Bacilli bacterium]